MQTAPHTMTTEVEPGIPFKRPSVAFAAPLVNRLRQLRLLFRENLSRPQVVRRPERGPMDEAESVARFHEQGQAGGTMLPLYHYNALALSRMLPAGGTLLDLGTGSGQFLVYLARCRPDVRLIGVDLSEDMVRLGRRALQESGLAERVELRIGDMTQLSGLAPERVDVVSSIFSLHHLPGPADLERCLGEIARLRRASGCGVWLFDHVRPRSEKTLEEFASLFIPEAPYTFRCNSNDSLRASFSFEEMRSCASRCLGRRLQSSCSRFLSLYQRHQLPREPAPWMGTPLACKDAGAFRALKWILPDPAK